MIIPAKRWLMVLVCCGAGFLAPLNCGAIDLFLKLAGINGESTDAAHPKEIVALGFSQGETYVSGTSGGGAGKATFSDLSISKLVDASTPLLYSYAAQGKPISQAVLTVRSSGANPIEFYRITLTNVIISSVQTSGAGGSDRPAESVTLKFAAIEWRYVPQNPDGTAGTPVVTTWNLLTNTP